MRKRIFASLGFAFLLCMSGVLSIENHRIHAQSKIAEQESFGLKMEQSVTTITLYWDYLGDATSYKVYRSQGDADNFVSIASMNDQNAWYYDDTKVQAATTYYYRVDAYQGTQKIASSAIINGHLNKMEAPELDVYTVDDNGSAPRFQLHWNEVYGCTKYEIYRATTANGPFSKIGTTTSFTYEDGKLIMNQPYYYKVKAIRTNEAIYSNVITRKLAPFSVPIVKSTSNTFSIELKWNFIDRADYYEIYRSTSSSGTYLKIAEIAQNPFISYQDIVGSKCKANQTYYYKIRAKRTINNKVNYGSFSKPVSGNIHLTKPSLKVSETTQLSLRWNAVASADRYMIYRSTNSTTGYKAVASVDTNSYVQKGNQITPNKRYYYRVVGINADNQVKSITSNTVSGRIRITKPSATTIKTTPINANQVKLTWKKATNATGYEIYRSTSKTKGFKKIATVGNKTSYNDTSKSLLPKKYYYYKIKPIRKFYQWKFVAPYSGVKSVKTSIPTTKVTSITSPGKGKVVVKWKRVNNARYKIYRSTSFNGSYKLIKTITNSSTTSYKNTGLKAGKKYYYKVRTYVVPSNKKSYYGNYSPRVKVTTCKKHTKYDVVDTAKAQKNKPYKWGGTGPKSFDCSGLIYYAYRQNGYKVPRAMAYAGHSIGKKTANIKMGDIVQYKGHFALVISKEKIPNTTFYAVRVIEALNKNAGIKENVYFMGPNGPYYNKNFLCFRRI